MIDAVRRIAVEQIDGAIVSAEGTGDPGTRVHDIRKSMKRMRGLIRLVQPVFADFARENRFFRNTSRSIGDFRDAEVAVATLNSVTETTQGPLDRSDFAAFGKELTSAQPAPPDLSAVAEDLTKARVRCERWILSETSWDAVAGGLHRTYRRARDGRKARGVEAMHAWRKPIKYHWYHTQLLENIGPEDMKTHGAIADALGDNLGLRQDLTVLYDRAATSDMPKEARRTLFGAIDARTTEIEAEIKRLAPLLLGEKPKRLTERWGSMWGAWREASEGGNSD